LNKVYMLLHIHLMEDRREDAKNLGIYSSKKKVFEEIKKYKTLAGFKDHPRGFHVYEYEIDKNLCEDDFITCHYLCE